MRTSLVRTPVALVALAGLAVGGVLVSFSTSASAATTPTPTDPVPAGINTPPSGAGTEQQYAPGKLGIHEGLEGGIGLGTGFSSTYGVGLEARVGYTFRQGVYAGGALQYYAGHSVNSQSAHATFLGGELGYKVFTSRHFEIRPYVFIGPSFITQVQDNPFFVNSSTSVAVQPSVLLNYHFGNAFVGADVRWLVTPSPATLAILANGGIGF
jgi:hypothetical protein